MNKEISISEYVNMNSSQRMKIKVEGYMNGEYHFAFDEIENEIYLTNGNDFSGLTDLTLDEAQEKAINLKDDSLLELVREIKTKISQSN